MSESCWSIPVVIFQTLLCGVVFGLRHIRCKVFLVFCPLPVFMSICTPAGWQTLDLCLGSAFKDHQLSFSFIFTAILFQQREKDLGSISKAPLTLTHTFCCPICCKLHEQQILPVCLSFFVSLRHTQMLNAADKPVQHHGNTRHSFRSTDELAAKWMNPRWLPEFDSILADAKPHTVRHRVEAKSVFSLGPALARMQANIYAGFLFHPLCRILVYLWAENGWMRNQENGFQLALRNC